MNTIRISLFCSLLLAPAVGFAQSSSEEFRVNGVIRDAGSGAPIQGARVSLLEGRDSTLQGHEDSNLAARTGIDGRFAINVPKPGVYSARAVADGYAAREFSRFFSIGGRAPSALTLDFDLVRTASVSGRLLDGETGKSIPGIRIAPRTVAYDRGRATIGFQVDAKPVVTDSDGAFRIAGLLPGNYLLELEPTDSAETIVRGRQAGTLPQAPKYRHQWWPGGQGPEAALSLALLAGTNYSIPNMRLSLAESYRILGHLRAQCEGTDGLQISLSATRGKALYTMANAHLPCGPDFTVVNVSPGEYDVVAIGRTAGQQVRFFRRATVIDRDVDLDLPASTAVAIHGQIEVPTNFPGDLKRNLAFAGEFEGDDGSFGGVTIRPGDDGSFEASAPSVGSVDLRLSGSPMPFPFYVSDILYNGSAVRDGLLVLNQHAASHELRIKVSDKGAELSGKVSLKDEPFPNGKVIVMPWPLRLKSSFPVYYIGAVNAEGTFAVGGLPPGSYRVLAVPTPAWQGTLQKPGALTAWAVKGISVDLGPSVSRNIPLDLTWVSADL
jgi:hypothetical protein